MKLSQFGRFLLSAVALCAMSLSITACSTGHTIAFLYVASTKVSPGNIYAYKIDGSSGALTNMPDSPFTSGGRNPVALITSPNGLFLYVANHDDSTIVENAIGTDGKVYAQCTYNLPGGTSFPNTMTTDPAGKFLLVAFNYQPGYTDSVPGPGGIVVYPIQPLTATASASNFCNTSAGTLGTPVVNPSNTSISYFPVGSNSPVSGLSPDSIVVTAGNFVYMSTSGKSRTSPGLTQIVDPTQIYGFSLNTTTGALTATTVQTNGSNTLSLVSALATDSTGAYLYATDSYLNLVYQFSVTNTGGLNFGSQVATGNGPSALTFDNHTSTHYLYVSNYTDNTISSYSLNSSTGALTALPSGASTNSATGSNPSAILVDPAFGYFVYTANYIDGTVSGKQITQQTGGLFNIQFTPFSSGGEPTALASTTSSAVLTSYDRVTPE